MRGGYREQETGVGREVGRGLTRTEKEQETVKRGNDKAWRVEEGERSRKEGRKRRNGGAWNQQGRRERREQE